MGRYLWHRMHFLRQVKAAGRQACLVPFSVSVVLDALLLGIILLVSFPGWMLLEVLMLGIF